MSLRRVAMMAALAALLAPVGTADAAKRKKPKSPVITSVSPMEAEIGDTLTIRGKHFRRGKGKNSVAFKRDGAPAVFQRADIATKRMLKVKVPKRLQEHLANEGAVKVETRFRLRVLAKRFGKRFTADRLSPRIGPDTPPPPPPPPAPSEDKGDCDGDGTLNRDEVDDDSDGLNDDVELSLKLDPCKPDTDGDGVADTWEYDCDRDRVLNRDEADDDNDLLDDGLENRIGTDGCSKDTDGDGVEDGYEYKSAVDLNDDEYQEPNRVLLYPERRPYPNALFKDDAGTDFDGDALTLTEEYKLWLLTIANGAPRQLLPTLTYSDGMQHSVHGTKADGRRMPSLAAAGYDKHQAFLGWAAGAGYATVMVQDVDEWWYGDLSDGDTYDIRDVNRDGALTAREWPADTSGDGRIWLRSESTYYDTDQDGWLDDGERDEDADGLTNFDESHGCMMDAAYWAKLYNKETRYPVVYGGTTLDAADSDGDGVRDGADDQDYDDIPNLWECSRQAASGRPFDPMDSPPDPADPTPQEGFVNPFSPCLPSVRSRTCNRNPSLSSPWAPFNANDKYYYVWN